MPDPMDLTIGDSTGTPPTGNVVKLYDQYSSGNLINAYPADVKFPEDEQLTRLEELDGAGVIQGKPEDYREGKIIWELLDLDILDNGAGTMVKELKDRRYITSGADYFIGATNTVGAFHLPENPMKIRIIDLFIEHIPNEENREFANVTMTFNRVT